MGGMLAWAWGETYPDFIDGLVPRWPAPAAMGRNWMMRRMIVEPSIAIPQWTAHYTQQPPS